MALVFGSLKLGLIGLIPNVAPIIAIGAIMGYLGVPLDILKEEDIENAILELLNKNEVAQIVFLSTWDILKARKRGEFRDMVLSSSLCLPVSKSIIKGASFLKKTVPTRHYPFKTIIAILNVINNYSKSLYMLGATKKSLAIAEDNVKSTFKDLKFRVYFFVTYSKK